MKKSSNSNSPVVKRFWPAKAARPSVGLDIGISSCRLVEIVKKDKSYELVRSASEPIYNGDAAAAIRRLMTKATPPVLAPASAVAGKGTLIRFVDMPQMNQTDLKKSFSLEVDKYFPFPKDQIYTDCCIIDPKIKDNKMSVLVAAARKELINDRIKLLGDAGLQADFIALNSTAIANVLNVLGSPDAGEVAADKSSGAIAVLDTGEAVSNLLIIVDNRPRFNRDIFIGGRDFTKSISNALRVTREEAEKLKKTPGPRPEEVKGIIESTIFDLVSEMKLSFDYFVTESNIAISQLLLTGGNSLLEELPDSLAKHLEIPVKKWDPLARLKSAAEAATTEPTEQGGPWAVALGLALYGCHD